MSALAFRDGAYFCAACQEQLRIPAGATVRNGYTTVHGGTRERVLFVSGHEVHRCTDLDVAGFAGTKHSARRR